MKILIAEDDDLTRRLLREQLTALGHQVVESGDGVQAWDLFQHDPVRVIIPDWRMPDMDGLALCRKVRAHPQTAYTYVILLTGTYTSKQNYYEAMEAGVDAFMTKPFNEEDLLVHLRVAERIINFHAQVRELKRLLPICMYCKKIRHDQDYWQEVESYMRANTGTDFTHGICPECYESRVRPELHAMRKDYDR